MDWEVNYISMWICNEKLSAAPLIPPQKIRAST
jgi:hypothetical protein